MWITFNYHLMILGKVFLEHSFNLDEFLWSPCGDALCFMLLRESFPF